MISTETREAIRQYRDHPDETPIEQLYLVRDGLAEIVNASNDGDSEIEIDDTTAWFYQLMWGAANDRIVEYETLKKRKSEGRGRRASDYQPSHHA